MGREGSEALVMVLEKASLRHLDLAKSSIDWDVIMLHLESLLGLRNLRTIDLSHNGFHPCIHDLIKACGDDLVSIKLQGVTLVIYSYLN